MGDRGGLHERAGLYYELANVSSRVIVNIVVAFDLYEPESRPYPAQGANRFVVHLDETLDPGQEHSFCTSLDTVVSVRTDVISPSRFHVRSITFADGAIWRNRGFHVCGELP